MSACEPALSETLVHVAGSVVSGQQIDWQGMTRELWVSRPCPVSPWNRVKVSSDLVMVPRAGSFTPLPDDAFPSARVPATLRHLPWLKLRVAGCDDDTVRPIWMDLGQSVIVPASGASAAIVGHRTFFEVNSSNQNAEVPPAGAEQTTIDAWIWVRVEEVTCCEPYDVLLTDSALVLLEPVDIIIPPRARCLTIHKGAGSALDVEWVIDDTQLVVGTAGMVAAAGQVVLTVPEATHVRLTSLGAGDNVVLVWGLHL